MDASCISPALGFLVDFVRDSPEKVEKMGIYQMAFCGVKKKVILIDTRVLGGWIRYEDDLTI